MSSLSTLPKGDSAWLLRKSIQRVMQQVSVLETNIGSSTTGNSANTQIIFNDAGTLRGDAQFTWNKTLNRLTVDGDETISGDLTVATSVLKVDTINDRVGIGTASPATILDIQSAGGLFARIQNTTSTADAYLLVKNTTGEGFFGINALGPYIYTASALPIVFTTATFERYRIAGDGVATWSNVGGVAGTAMTLNSSGLGVGVVPSYKLDVAGIVRIGGGVNPSMRLETGTNTGFIDYNNTRLALHAGSLPIDFVAGNTTKMTLDTSGNLLVGVTSANANGGVLQLKSGITFPATQVASSDANTLDDYEEGTWTPVIKGASTAGTGTYIVQVGTYTKVGRVVYFQGRLAWNAHTGTGDMQIGGIPFTSLSTTNSNSPCNFGYINNLSLSASSVLTGFVFPNTNDIGLYQYPAGGGAATTVTIDTSADIIFSGTYFV